MKNNILVIKHGAFGDIILAGAAMQAIRHHHKNDYIICLTTNKFEKLLKSSPWFDMVVVDPKPKWHNFKDWKTLKSFFNKFQYKNIYDLQTSYRSNLYFYLFFLYKKSYWSGIALGSKYRQINKDRKRLHTLSRQKNQLKFAGIKYDYLPDWKWLAKDYENRNILPREKFVILVAGTAKHRINKKWPTENFAKLIECLSIIGIQSILLGGKEEFNNFNRIIKSIENSTKIIPINYAGKTSFEDIVFLSAYAKCAIGNDTGPMHLISSCGLNTIVLFGSGSNPDLCAPIGKNVSIIKNNEIRDISVDKVFNKIKNIVLD